MGQTRLFFPQGFSEIEPGFFTRPPRLLSLDFDGTLSEIAPTPNAALMPEEFRALLTGLFHLPKTRLAILSGRSIPDLKAKVRVSGLQYVGNHGLDFSPPSAGWGISALSGWTRQVREARERLEPLVKRWPGALLETKGPDLSLHYRLLEPAHVGQLIPEALGAVEGLPVTLRRGKCVLEFRPKDAPGKAEALERLAGRLFGEFGSGVCLHIGDDQTDEDAFRLLRDMGPPALGLKVGCEPTRAHYRLKGPGEVYKFLKLFVEN